MQGWSLVPQLKMLVAGAEEQLGVVQFPVPLPISGHEEEAGEGFRWWKVLSTSYKASLAKTQLVPHLSVAPTRLVIHYPSLGSVLSRLHGLPTALTCWLPHSKSSSALIRCG